MPWQRSAVAFLLMLLAAVPLAMAQTTLAKLSNQEATSGLKAALEQGTSAAVSTLGRKDGFLGDARVKIPLPGSAQKAERLMRSVGMGKQADELILAMNRAAEAAVPEARALFSDAVKNMTVEDAKGILGGGETAGTEYFRKTTSTQLAARFLPIVQKETEKVQLAKLYNQYAERGAKFGLVGQDQANLDSYVTQKALDGLFLMVGEEERKIRKDPIGSATGLVSKVFGAVR